ncbi:MAG: hypothetical protein ACLRYY_04325 [Anaerobutyricum soehngenii]
MDIYEVELTYGIEQNNPFVIYMLDASNVLMRPAFSVAKIADKTTNEEGKKQCCLMKRPAVI